MKNPFEKEDNTLLFAAIAIGAVAAGAVAYLLLTDDGEKVLEKISDKIKEAIKDAASGVVSDKTGVSKKTVKKVADHVVK